LKDQKKKELERLLEQGTVMVFIDSRSDGVQVPDEFMGNPQLGLNFDYSFQIPDFKILEDRLEATLEFFGTMNFFCVLPFESIYAIKSDRIQESVFFPEDVPTDFILQKKAQDEAKSAPKKEKETEPKKKKPKGRPKLVAVTTPSSKKKKSPKKSTKGTKKKSTKKKKGSHLKLVK